MDKREMKAGRELDALVAEKVMGWIPSWGNWWMAGYGEMNCSLDKATEWSFEAEKGVEYRGKKYQSIPLHRWCPSTDISAAWEIVEKMREVGYFIRLADQDEFIRARFYNPNFLPDEKSLWIVAETVPEAICKAALLAMEDKT